MLNCTDTVYILLLHSGLHLLHAPFRPKINMFYGLLLLAMETKTNKKKSTVGYHSGFNYTFFFGKIGKINDTKKMCPVYPFKLRIRLCIQVGGRAQDD